MVISLSFFVNGCSKFIDVYDGTVVGWRNYLREVCIRALNAAPEGAEGSAQYALSTRASFVAVKNIIEAAYFVEIGFIWRGKIMVERLRGLGFLEWFHIEMMAHRICACFTYCAETRI